MVVLASVMSLRIDTSGVVTSTVGLVVVFTMLVAMLAFCIAIKPVAIPRIGAMLAITLSDAGFTISAAKPEAGSIRGAGPSLDTKIGIGSISCIGSLDEVSFSASSSNVEFDQDDSIGSCSHVSRLDRDWS